MNLSALYLSLKRLSEILDGSTFVIDKEVGAIRKVASHGFGRVGLVYALETTVLEWLSKVNPPTLGELLATSTVKAGTIFTHYGAFFGKGIIEATVQYDGGKPLKSKPYLWAKLDSFIPGATLHVQAHPENFTSNSAPEELSGQKRLFLLARIVESSPPEFTAQAYVVGHLYDAKRSAGLTIDTLGRLQFHMELFPGQIDNFGLIQNGAAPTKKQLGRLEKVPEKDIKKAFAEIIGESFVPKDWGGEKSDLFTTSVQVDGQPMATAFALKGPAVFKPLTVAGLGKNGDQISRLFSEPAEGKEKGTGEKKRGQATFR